MPRFFTTLIDETRAVIEGEDAKHIEKVLRMKKGERLILCDKNGKDYISTLTGFEDGRVLFTVEKVIPSASEPTTKVCLFQALPKGDKMELIIQKAVELGVDEIVPVLTKRCVSRPDQKSWEKKEIRYNRIALEAAKQSGRGKIPRVHPYIEFKEAISRMENQPGTILFYEESDHSFLEFMEKPFSQYAIMIGAEGGFDPEEVAFAKEKGIASLSLGKRILRCETAPLAAISAIMFATGNL